MIILDFYGLPGCGKSTISHLLANKLRKENFEVDEPSWKTDRLPTWKRIWIKLCAATSYTVCHKSIIWTIMKESKNCKLTKATVKLWINTGYIMHMVTKDKRCDYRIFDQGIAQAVISLYTENSLTNCSEMYNCLVAHIKSDIVPIYISVEISSAVKRMNERKEKKSRAEKLEGQKRDKMMERIKELCEEIEDDTIFCDNEENKINTMERLYSILETKVEEIGRKNK